jgi:alkanesulfonate monooxygenase SsuD/methylene tetrahydromethanopterin reductase-like flavin-dependent oxidoreductase (luciferase family)
VRFGVVILPESTWKEAAPRWARAEELGFVHAWTYDHLTWRGFRDEPWYAAIPTLTAAALATTHIGLGTLVASPNFRHPLPFVKDLVALDDIAGGRLIAGIGSGGVGWDATMLGHPAWSPAERADRFAEFVELVDVLLRHPDTTWHGRYYAVDEARTYPARTIPLAIAATGPRAMRLAARFATTWVTAGSGDDILDASRGARAVGDQIRRLEDVCHTSGRDPGSLRRLVLTGPGLHAGLGSVDEFTDTVARYEQQGVTDFVVHWPRPTEPFKADMRVFERLPIR